LHVWHGISRAKDVPSTLPVGEFKKDEHFADSLEVASAILRTGYVVVEPRAIKLPRRD
jgi:hypothetical protein